LVVGNIQHLQNMLERTSFMDDKSRAVSEMHRVLRDWGFCSVTNLFYPTKPPKSVLKKVSDIIGVEINYMTEKDWLDLYTSSKQFEVYKFET
jgi:ubiquinone/menaquinone biosynthesis C-methylase UbiE